MDRKFSVYSRKQCVGVNGKFSKWFLVNSGIPQGSILGPILFLIYINDLPESCDISSYDVNLYLYADDAKVYKTIKNSEDNTRAHHAWDTRTWRDVSSYLFTYLPRNYDTPV